MDWSKFGTFSLGIAIGIIITWIFVVFYKKIRYSSRYEDKAYFVSSRDKCCNPFIKDYKPGPRCKANCPGQLLEKIRAEIEDANSSVCIAMFNFTNTKLANSIVRCAGKSPHIKIRIIMDKNKYIENEEQMKQKEKDGQNEDEKQEKKEKPITSIGQILDKKGN